MSSKKNESPEKTVDSILSLIIDEWYERVSSYYVTLEQRRENPELTKEEELKRFHDDKGHRIKFDKDSLDFTYGLRSIWGGNHIIIEVSVNNKVAKFDYADFQERLLSYYEKTGRQNVPSPYELRAHAFEEILQFEPNLRDAFKVEKREDKADIMRLSFHLNEGFVDRILAHPQASKKLIEDYCVSPFRTVYATVYRRSK